MTTLAHLSDLHVGRAPSDEVTLERLVRAAGDADTVIVTGDLTERGTTAEYARFRALTAPLADRLVVVPGNHDRCGDDLGATLMNGARVDVLHRDELAIVRVDSTAPHNRVPWLSHGRLCEVMLEQIDRALTSVARSPVVVVALHHHVVPLPPEGFWESVSAVLGLPNHSELVLGTALLRLLRGRCDLVLHGHRHVPRALVVDEDGPRPMQVFNAGSSTELGAFRVLEPSGAWAWRSLSSRSVPTFEPAFALQLG